MGVFFIYILKSSVCLVLFYLFFRLLLSKETFHRFNRMALLGVLFFSLLIPCIEVTTRHQVEVQQAVLSIEQLLLMAELEATPANVGAVQETSAISWVQIVLLVYLAGILFLACRNIYSLICLFRLIHSGKHEKLEKGVTLVVHNQEIAPFSWMNYIVISRKDLEENGREILIHEMAHIHHRHSVDLLVADICIFFQWFNPGAWLLKQELQNVHEYEADETVINEGVNAKEYQLLLIKKAVGTRLYSMANSFNHSKLKKRITMMLKEKSNPWARLKYLYVLPLAAIAVTAFARPEISEKMEEISAVKVNDLAEIVQEKVLQDTVKVSKDEKKDDLVVSGVKSKEEEEIVIFEVVRVCEVFGRCISCIFCIFPVVHHFLFAESYTRPFSKMECSAQMDVSMPGSKCVREYPFGMFPFVLGRHPAQPMEKLASLFSAIRCDGERQLYIFSIRRGNIRSCSFNRLTEAA